MQTPELLSRRPQAQSAQAELAGTPRDGVGLGGSSTGHTELCQGRTVGSQTWGRTVCQEEQVLPGDTRGAQGVQDGHVRVQQCRFCAWQGGCNVGAVCAQWVRPAGGRRAGGVCRHQGGRAQEGGHRQRRV